MTQSLFDAVICGGGAVGATLAIALGQLGYEVALIEQKAPQALTQACAAFEARTLALSHASIYLYQALGIWADLIDQAVPIRTVRVSVQGQYGSSCLKNPRSDRSDHPLGYVVAADHLARALYARLATLKNVDILQPATLIDSQVSPDGWRLDVLPTDQALKTIHAQLLVSAEGAQGELSKKQQIATQETAYGHFALTTNIQLQPGLQQGAVERFFKQGAIALLPWQGDYATCVISCSKQQAQALAQLDPQGFMQACENFLGSRQGRVVGVGRRQLFPLKMVLANQQTSARFLLMGNAAHALHPIAAQGLNLSLRDIGHIRQRLFTLGLKQDLGDPAFLADYQAQRRGDQMRTCVGTDLIARFMSGGPLPPALRSAGLVLFDLMPGVKSIFTKMSMGIS